MSKDTKAIMKRRAELIEQLTKEQPVRTGVRAGSVLFRPPEPCLSPASIASATSCLIPQICLSPVS